ncbi:MAG: hypothetical protein K8R40_12660 [Anaerolineaceae bacterium]|nr:hypothetical protein [Anaerolineaceae bacterium]
MSMTREEVQSAISSLDYKVDNLRTASTLADMRKETSALEQNIDGFIARLKTIRDYGYVFDRELEGQLEDFEQNWKGMKHTVSAEISRRARALEENFKQVDANMRRIASYANRPSTAETQITRLENRIDDLEDSVETAQDTIRSRYQPLKDGVNAVEARLAYLEWMYEELNQANFNLLQSESMVMAARVRWYHDGKADKKDPKGILFLSDQRLILEVHEKEVKKKFLFVATESETTRKVAFECPVDYIEKTESFQQGLLKGKDHLRIFFTAQGPYDKTQFHLLNSDNDEFCQTIRRIQSGDFLNNRTEEVSEEVLERVKNAPSECPSCGGIITQEILRGQDNLTCDYCGYVIRL